MITGPPPDTVSVELVALDPAGEAESNRRYAAVSDGALLAGLLVGTEGSWLRPSALQLRADSRMVQRRALVASLLNEAAGRGLNGVVLEAGIPLLLRHDARAAGFTGPLRRELVADLRRPLPAPASGTRLEDRLLSELAPLLPGIEVRLGSEGRFRVAARSVLRGTVNIGTLQARGAHDSRPLRILFPLADDVMPEALALVIDTALSIRHRFRPVLDRVRITFDQSTHGLVNGKWAGLAEQSRDVRLTPAYARVGDLEALTVQLANRDRPAEGDAPQVQVARIRSYQGAAPFTRIDAVVAHEMWHEIQFDFDNSRVRDGIEFRRALGAYFGTETLEQVIKGKGPKASPAWRAACVRLATEVSTYATTEPREATAEMFSVWWCTPQSPPPVAQLFDRLLHQFFPAADLAR